MNPIASATVDGRGLGNIVLVNLEIGNVVVRTDVSRDDWFPELGGAIGVHQRGRGIGPHNVGDVVAVYRYRDGFSSGGGRHT